MGRKSRSLDGENIGLRNSSCCQIMHLRFPGNPLKVSRIRPCWYNIHIFPLFMTLWALLFPLVRQNSTDFVQFIRISANVIWVRSQCRACFAPWNGKIIPHLSSSPSFRFGGGASLETHTFVESEWLGGGTRNRSCVATPFEAYGNVQGDSWPNSRWIVFTRLIDG